MTLIAPEYPHLFRSEPGWDLIWFHFLMRPHLTAELHWPEEAPGLRHCRLAGADFRRGRAALLEASQLDHRRASGWHGWPTRCSKRRLCAVLPGISKAAATGSGSPAPSVCCCRGRRKACPWTGLLRSAACRGRNSMRRSSAPREFRRAPGGSFSCCGARSSCAEHVAAGCGDRAPARHGGPVLFLHPVPALLRAAADGIPAEPPGAG